MLSQTLRHCPPRKLQPLFEEQDMKATADPPRGFVSDLN